MAPDELSTCSSAGDSRSSKLTAPSAASTGSFRAAFLISESACPIRLMGGADYRIAPAAFLTISKKQSP